MSEAPVMKINRVAGWFGGNAALAELVGRELGTLDWCGVPFAGGMPELPFIKARSGIANDLHRHVINLARVIASPDLWPELVQTLDGRLFHPDEIKAAQAACAAREMGPSALFDGGSAAGDEPDVQWAAAYFVACWMGRGGHAGKGTEFTQGLAMRWTASGGSSAVRFQSAVKSIQAWHLVLKRWEFSTLDVFAFLSMIHDKPGHGLYLDPPWPEAGTEYKHRFSDARQGQLAERLASLRNVRVVLRFGDHPLIRALYPAPRWTWIENSSRNQKNDAIAEVLIINGPSLAGGGA